MTTENKTECKLCVVHEGQIRSLTPHNQKLIRGVEWAWNREKDLHLRVFELMQEIDSLRKGEDYD